MVAHVYLHEPFDEGSAGGPISEDQRVNRQKKRSGPVNFSL